MSYQDPDKPIGSRRLSFGADYDQDGDADAILGAPKIITDLGVLFYGLEGVHGAFGGESDDKGR